jgi:hypothetical protein
MVSVCTYEDELIELAELLRELEQTLQTLKATEEPARRRLLVRKISRLFTQIEGKPIASNMSRYPPIHLE